MPPWDMLRITSFRRNHPLIRTGRSAYAMAAEEFGCAPTDSTLTTRMELDVRCRQQSPRPWPWAINKGTWYRRRPELVPLGLYMPSMLAVWPRHMSPLVSLELCSWEKDLVLWFILNFHRRIILTRPSFWTPRRRLLKHPHSCPWQRPRPRALVAVMAMQSLSLVRFFPLLTLPNGLSAWPR